MRYAQAVVLILALAPHVAGAQVVDKCQAFKIKAAGRKTYDKAKCRAKALTKGTTIDPLCLTKAENKFVKAMTRADTVGSCSGTASELEAAVDQCVDTYAAVVSVPVTSTTVTSLTTTTTTTSEITTTTTTSVTTTTLRAPCGPGALCNSALICDDGFGCATDESGNCLCVPTPSCGESAYPTCGGNCPDGTVCAPQHVDVLIADFYLCACVQPDHACEGTVCTYGACPPEEVCRVNHQIGPDCTRGCVAP